ncbi:baculovirus F protein domain-containing protein [Phthorimaea operculella]|nr:baculovirus F protein domain-containing protein [Phthorimaea operculella]
MFNIHLLSPKQLRDELNVISGQLPRDLSLPIANIQTDIAKIYHILRVKARVTEQYIIFEIKIPLINRENFDLYRVIPIPQQVENNTIISIVPVSDHIAINLRKDTYLAMTKNDIQQCLHYDEYTSLCHTQKPVYNLQMDDGLCIRDLVTNKCATKIETCRNNWTEMSKTNTYLFYCCGHCALRLICGSQITSIQVQKAGIIGFEQDCVIKGDDFTVFSHNNKRIETKMSADLYIPDIAPINHIINVSVPLIEMNSTSEQSSEITKIGKQIEQMKSETPLPETLSYHDIHQFTAIYILMIGCMVASTVYVVRCVRRRRRLRGSVNLQSKVENPSTHINEIPRPAVLPRSAHTTLTLAQENIELKTLSNANRAAIKQDKATSPIIKRPIINVDEF